MKRLTPLLMLLVSVLAIQSCCKQVQPVRETEKITRNWKFILDDQPDFKNPDFDDADWRTLNVPHDWSIEGEFSEDNPASPGGGALPGGTGWYRKSIYLDQADANKQIFIDFDGVYMNSEVYINGHLLGKRPFGYISFRYELTPWIKFGTENTIAVRVDNSQQPNSRWYSGSGIYRNVWLVKTKPLHVAHWGTYITTPHVSKEKATVNVETTIENNYPEQKNAELKTRLVDADGNSVAESTVPFLLESGIDTTLSQKLEVTTPQLWSTTTPHLYTAVSEVYVDGRLVDNYKTTVGIRSFRFDAEKGFFLNDEHLKILGVCNHHDLGCLGAAINTRALERQLEILKAMGCNSIRTSHNPPAPELLQLCDKMGFIVQDETFDMWRKRKTTYDYSQYFPDWYEKDLTDHILRDRNHASVMMWSIGNEVLEQWTDAGADTLNAQEANLLLNFQRDPSSLASGDEMSVNSMLTKKLADIVHTLDPTRPVTTGNNEPNPNNHIYKSNALDLIGYNYHESWFLDVPKNFPGKPFIVTESTSALMTRGYYRMPSDSIYKWPVRWDVPFSDPSYKCSSYDNCHAPWGSTHEDVWRMVRDNDFISGLYVWTGFDYLGEPTPYWWPARSSYFGIIDLAGFPKDIYYLYQSEWTDKDVLHLFPHWNWEPGQTIDLWAYYNNADEVELFVNGVSQGVKKKENGAMHVMWRVKFEPGTIKAVSRKDGKVVLEKEIHTAGDPTQIRLTADRNQIAADGYDLSFVTVEVLDADGNLCPNAMNQIQLKLEGDGFIAGVDNGDQTSHEPMKGSTIKAFYGKCLAIVQANENPGTLSLTASSAGLTDATIQIEIK
ncbi:glycoside hydrolase family 2 TIM barrel-domain containing protein [Mangrovibacterium diazotrophicum]|uniref:Beta-galactosidase n=1 Tax=Mangrovibacterium diazotrophicum TaxID=1261403 RepID=A0A419VWK0_9BACT|nr:glycoside hydrolase family 2 TIM barrel-domain containing protein [Mangrovibacterium diazotrophicum]RKD86481.1 beta-galactosidase [Mangrovibacterium diazotrophicum]